MIFLEIDVERTAKHKFSRKRVRNKFYCKGI